MSENKRPVKSHTPENFNRVLERHRLETKRWENFRKNFRLLSKDERSELRNTGNFLEPEMKAILSIKGSEELISRTFECFEFFDKKYKPKKIFSNDMKDFSVRERYKASILYTFSSALHNREKEFRNISIEMVVDSLYKDYIINISFYNRNLGRVVYSEQRFECNAFHEEDVKMIDGLMIDLKEIRNKEDNLNKGNSYSERTVDVEPESDSASARGFDNSNHMPIDRENNAIGRNVLFLTERVELIQANNPTKTETSVLIEQKSDSAIARADSASAGGFGDTNHVSKGRGRGKRLVTRDVSSLTKIDDLSKKNDQSERSVDVESKSDSASAGGFSDTDYTIRGRGRGRGRGKDLFTRDVHSLTRRDELNIGGDYIVNDYLESNVDVKLNSDDSTRGSDNPNSKNDNTQAQSMQGLLLDLDITDSSSYIEPQQVVTEAEKSSAQTTFEHLLSDLEINNLLSNIECHQVVSRKEKTPAQLMSEHYEIQHAYNILKKKFSTDDFAELFNSMVRTKRFEVEGLEPLSKMITKLEHNNYLRKNGNPERSKIKMLEQRHTESVMGIMLEVQMFISNFLPVSNSNLREKMPHFLDFLKAFEAICEKGYVREQELSKKQSTSFHR